MLKRLVAATLLSLMPFTALADDVPTASPDYQVQNETQPGGGTSSNVQGAPTGLGQPAPTAGGSNADSGSLQPATGTGLGAGATDATGLVAPTSLLQAPSTNTDQLRVLLNGEADGAPNNLADDDTTSNDALTDILLLALLAAIVLGAFWTRRRQLARARARYAHIN